MIMGQNDKDISNSTNEENLRDMDRRNNTILGTSGAVMITISLIGVFTGLLPILWGEISIVIVLGALYNWSKRRQRIDLRLGCVYTAVGILVSFTLMTIGIIGSLLVYSNFPFLMEGSTSQILIYPPIFVSFFIAYKITSPIGQSIAKKQWLRIDKGLTNQNYDPLNLGKFYLVEKKWTNFWFYLFLFVIVELFPIVFQNGFTMNPMFIFLYIGGLILTMFWAYHILKNRPNLT
jgi:hypothetical protein